MILATWQKEIEARPSVQEAGEALEAARSKLAGVVEEVEAHRVELSGIEARIQEVTATGDPEGVIRALSRQRRSLVARLEEAEADLGAQEAAGKGAHHSWHRARLAAMGETWQELPLGEVAERFEARVRDLAEVTREVMEIHAARKWGHDTSNNVVVRILEGEANTPRLPAPDLGIPDLDFRRFAQDLERIIQRMTPKQEP